MIFPILLTAIACFDLGTPPIRHDGQVMAVAISPDGQLIASAGLYDEIRISDTRGKLIRSMSAKKLGRGFYSIIFSPSGKELFAGTESEVIVYETATGKTLRSWNAEDRRIGGLAISPDGKTLATRGSREKSVRLWDAETGKLETTLEGHDDWQFPTLRWAGPDRLLLATFAGVATWDVKKREMIYQLPASTGGGLDVSPKNDAFVTGGENTNTHVSLRDIRTGKEIRAFEHTLSIPYSYTFSSDGKSLISGGQDQMVVIFDIATGDVLFKRKMDGIVRGMAYSSKEDLLAVATSAGKVWLIRPGKLK